MENIQSLKAQIAETEQHLAELKKRLEQLESEKSYVILSGDTETAYVIDKTTKQVVHGVAIAPNQVKVSTEGLSDGYHKAKYFNPESYLKYGFKRILVKSGSVVAVFDSEREVTEYEKIHGLQDPDRIQHRQDLIANPRKLDGTIKQIRWAEDIRRKIIAKHKNPDDIPLEILKETSAGIFINHYRRQYSL